MLGTVCYSQVLHQVRYVGRERIGSHFGLMGLFIMLNPDLGVKDRLYVGRVLM